MAVLRWTIKRKLLALGGGTLLPLLGLLGFWAWWEVREETRALEAELSLAAVQAAREVEEALGRLVGRLAALARDPAVRGGEPGAVLGRLRDLWPEHPEIDHASLLGPDGRVRVTTVPNPPSPVTLADRPWFRQAITTGRPAVSGLLVGRLTGRPTVVVAVPVGRGADPPAGLLAATLGLERLHELFAHAPLPEGRTLTLLDAEGRVLAHAPSGGPRIGHRHPAAPLTAGPAGVRRVPGPEGNRLLAAAAPVRGTGWQTLAAAPEAAATRPAWREFRAVGLPALGLLALSSAVGFLIARRIWRPLEALAVAAAELARGRHLPVPVDATDEVGALARAFDAMATEIVAGRASLERRVAELAATAEAARLLTGTLELPEVLGRLAELARARLGADVVRIWLRPDGSEELHLAAESGVTRAARFRRALRAGEGLVGVILARREPLVVPDLPADPRVQNREWMAAEGVCSFLGAPIVVEDAVAGVLACLTRTRREFTAVEVGVSQILASQAAGAIRNARLHAQVRARAAELAERNRQLGLLHEAARTLAGEHDLDRVLQRLVEAARDLTGARYGALALFEARDRPQRLFTVGVSAEERERIGRLPEGRGLLGHIVRQGQVLRLDDLTAHPAATGFPPGHPPMRSFLGAPIRVRQAIAGALYLAEKPGGFTPEDEAGVVALCADAAVALDNARLLADLRQALDHLRAAQDQLLRAETLRAVGELAAGTAHHLNNILTVVKGRLELSVGKVREPEVRRSLEIAQRAADEAADVVRRLQEFARGGSPAAPVPVDVNRLVAEALELARPQWRDQAERRGVSIAVRWEPGEIPPARGEPAALREVLVSLLLNAVDALPHGGTITLRSWADAERVHLVVADDGAGMTEEVRQRALEPFFTTKGPHRRGLGLSVSHGIVRRHGGTLVIDSAPGRGTTVTVSLPIAPPPPAPQTAPAPVTARRILVIDDEPEVRDTLAEMLRGLGHHVTTAASGAEGLARVEAGRPDLVFTDLGMPGMTGWEVCRAIKAASPATPVVLVTGWGEEVASARVGPGGPDLVLRKPFDVARVALALGRALHCSPDATPPTSAPAAPEG